MRMARSYKSAFKKALVLFWWLLLLCVHFFSFGMHYTFGSSQSQLLVIRSIYAGCLVILFFLVRKKWHTLVFALGFIALLFPKLLGLIMPDLFAIYSPTMFSGSEFERAQWQFLIYSFILSVMLAGASFFVSKFFLLYQRE